MIQIAIGQAAIGEIAATMLLGSVNYEAQTNAKGERLIWLEERWPDKLNSSRRSGESYSEAIIRLATREGRWAHKRRWASSALARVTAT
jgi:hypothetical protein